MAVFGEKILQTTLVRTGGITIPEAWANSFARQFLLGHQLPAGGITPGEATVLGSMETICPGDAESIRSREINFTDIAGFEAWLRCWYPRRDQVWNTVGAPPATVRRVYYVIDDTNTATQIARWTGLPAFEIEKTIQAIHHELGAPAIQAHLAAFGWQGELFAVYTSDLKMEYDLAMRIWERMLGHCFKPGGRALAHTAIRYTHLWADMLGINGKAVIYEPHGRMYFPEQTPDWLREWFFKNQYGQNGLNRNLGILGYQAYQCDGQPSCALPHWAL